MGCILLQAQAAISSAISVTLRCAACHRFNAATLTYWDEAVAFSGIGFLAHAGSRLFAA